MKDVLLKIMNKKVVYLWCDLDIPFYVGKGNVDRPYSNKNRNQRILNKRKKCEMRKTFNIFIVSSGISNEYACILEKSIISNNPQLFNYTKGGDGGDTFSKMSEEEKIKKRKKLSEAALKNKDKLSEYGKVGAKIVVENKLGVHGCSSDKLKEWGYKGGKISGKKCKENKTGIFSLDEYQMKEIRSIGGKIGGEKTSTQKWICLVTGFICNAGGLTNYQRKRGIDTSLRKKLDNTSESVVK